jgi:hypothetical protein
MKIEPIQPDFISDAGRSFQVMDVPQERALVLAEEVGSLNARILLLGDRLRFTDEPSDFAGVLFVGAR